MNVPTFVKFPPTFRVALTASVPPVFVRLPTVRLPLLIVSVPVLMVRLSGTVATVLLTVTVTFKPIVAVSPTVGT